MAETRLPPTPYPAINALLDEVLAGAQRILGSQFLGMYLEGSLATGAFDEASDIDFIVVTQEEVSQEHFAALQAMHERIADRGTPWAIQLEGSYIGRRALRRYDPARATHPNIERGQGERLKWARHGADWLVHRQIARTRGIVLAGPPPDALIDPILPDDLRAAMRSTLSTWVVPLLEDPARIHPRGYQSYIVLSLCRILYTLETGAVASKREAAGWARETLGERWHPLIERAWEGRQHPDAEPSPEEVAGTVALLSYVIQRYAS